MIDAIGVADQGIRHAAQVKQAIPVGIIARQAGNFEAQDDPDMAQCDLRGQPGKAGAVRPLAPERPRSWSMTATCPRNQPSSTARSAEANWRAVDSRLCST